MQVRQWASAGCTTPVPGRSVSIVRLDTGEVIRTFMRADTANEPTNGLDTPSSSYALLTANSGATGTNAAGYRFIGRIIDTQLDSPMTGTPAVYPSEVGAIAQKFFIGDADGTVWRFDISSKNPNEWFGEVYLDAFNVTGQSSAGFASDTGWGAKAREPLAGPPLLSLDRTGNVSVSIATGDQNAIGSANTYPNFVWATSEVPQLDSSTGLTRLRAQVWWFDPLLSGEMVTGPMAVFNGIWLFTSYVPAAVSASCQQGIGRFWEMDFMAPNGSATPPASGGVARMPSPSSPGTFVQSMDLTTSVIPGVVLSSSLVCATGTSSSDPLVGGTSLSMGNVQPSQMTATLITGGIGKALKDVSQTLPTPRQTTIVDSWAAIVE
jgi:type IV pilus assembly protein PilY1